LAAAAWRERHDDDARAAWVAVDDLAAMLPPWVRAELAAQPGSGRGGALHTGTAKPGMATAVVVAAAAAGSSSSGSSGNTTTTSSNSSSSSSSRGGRCLSPGGVFSQGRAAWPGRGAAATAPAPTADAAVAEGRRRLAEGRTPDPLFNACARVLALYGETLLSR
jgi:hypothetical protein